MLWNATIHYHFHNSPPLVPLLSQINPVYANGILILPPPPNQHLGLHVVSFRFLPPKPLQESLLPYACSTLRPSSFFLFFIIKMSGEEYKLRPPHSKLILLAPAHDAVYFTMMCQYFKNLPPTTSKAVCSKCSNKLHGVTCHKTTLLIFMAEKTPRIDEITSVSTVKTTSR